MVDARMADGSRVNAVVPPLAVDGPCLTIRRFGEAGHVSGSVWGLTDGQTEVLSVPQRAACVILRHEGRELARVQAVLSAGRVTEVRF